ncbi:MAG: GC-type dockerin domain-anchored protein, partial [Planctomycetota bacterium]
TGNHVATSGSAIWNFRSQTVYTNCLVWGNTRGAAFTADYAAQVNNATPTAGEVPPQFDHCIVQGWTGFYVGVNNDGIDPQLTDPDGPDDILGTIDDTPIPGAGSHANDRGLNSAVTAGVTTDLLGNPRFADDPAATDLGTAPVVDIGAYEFASAACSAADVTTDGTANGSPDGAVTLSDFSFYLSLWAGSNAAADVTTDGTANGIPDGAVTLSDFSFYLSLWSTGCP